MRGWRGWMRLCYICCMDLPPMPASAELLTHLLSQAETTFRAARASSTLRAYSHDWKQFGAWCEQNHLAALPASPQAVVLYATDLVKNRTKKLNSLSRRFAAVSQMHQQAASNHPRAIGR